MKRRGKRQGICGQTQADGTICTNAAGCKIPHSQQVAAAAQATVTATGGGYRDPADPHPEIKYAVLSGYAAGVLTGATIKDEDRGWVGPARDRAMLGWETLSRALAADGESWEDFLESSSARLFPPMADAATLEHLAEAADYKAAQWWSRPLPWLYEGGDFEPPDADDASHHATGFVMLSLMLRGAEPEAALQSAYAANEAVEETADHLRDDWEHRDDAAWWQDDDGSFPRDAWEPEHDFDRQVEAALETARAAALPPAVAAAI